jgi:hypothetical protein
MFNPPNGVDDPYYGDMDAFETMFTNIDGVMKPFLTEHGLLE